MGAPRNACLWTACIAVAITCATAAPKTIVTIIIDDLGHYDTSVYNPNAPTPHLKELADGGVRLGRLYTYKYCSPTRRSFLSGRLPIRLTGAQAQPCSNWLPLEFTLLPEKLGQANFTSHVVGKGHWGYQTTDHLPVHRGFATHVGYLCGAENYSFGNNYGPTHDCSGTPQDCYKDMWHDNHTGADVIDDIYYSSNYYARRAVQLLEAADPSESLFLALLFQGVHVPYTAVPAWEDQPTPHGMWDRTYSNMLRIVDDGIGNVTAALKATGRWNNTLLIVTSDNGGIEEGNNYPLRGQKATTWEGGCRVMSFLAGGFLEAVPNFDTHLKGSTNERFIHISDWYATLSTLVGVDPTDNVTLDGKVRPIDSIDVWPLITYINGSSSPLPAGHSDFLPITEETILYQERYKLINNAQATFWTTTNHSLIHDNRTAWPCRNKKPGPSNCTAVKGFTCEAAHYCGPEKSFFWQHSVSLTDCAAACAQQMHGQCRCFDYREGTANRAQNCRLHLSANHLEPSSQGYAAYISDSAEAREALARMAAASMVTISTDADVVQGSDRNRAILERESGTSCNVCTEEQPCLFDLLKDPEERTDISLENPDIVKKMAAALAEYNSWHINGTMNPDTLKNNYECIVDTRQWWQNFSGPCCRPK